MLSLYMHARGLHGEVGSRGATGVASEEAARNYPMPGGANASQLRDGAELHLQPTEDPTLELVGVPEGGCKPVGTHTGAGCS